MLYDQLQPFFTGALAAWRGLPLATPASFDESLGPPVEHTLTELGFYPADRYVYPLEVPSGGLVAYARQNRIILIEAIQPPPLSAIAGLPEPCGIKPQEILVPDAYAHEYVYCEIGLVLTVAKVLKGNALDQLVRCRGIRPITTARDFDAQYYKAFEDRIQWETT